MAQIYLPELAGYFLSTGRIKYLDSHMTLSEQSRRVLVVDGNSDSSEALVQLLEMKGYEARATPDGPSCLTEAARFYPHVICSSIKMNGMSGLDLARELRKMSESRGALLIATTGLRGEWISMEMTNAGFDINLRKPIDFDEFFGILDAFFGNIER